VLCDFLALDQYPLRQSVALYARPVRRAPAQGDAGAVSGSIDCKQGVFVMNHGRTMRRIAYHAALNGLLGMALGLASTAVYAVPSFARQTGMPCGACHTVFPELTAFGRTFKLNGYTLTGIKQIKSTSAAGSMKINEIPPLSAMLQVGFTRVNKKAPGQQNDNVEFPQALSLYYAGEISPHMGTFMQVTMGPSGGFEFDMADVRYANHATLGGHGLVYGVTLNNSPGMEDVWNTTTAWTYPYTASDTAPGPNAQPLLADMDGFMDQVKMVAGLGGYALWDNHWYGAVTVYRSAAPMGKIHNVAPYWRFAWQGYLPNHAYLEVGTYGLYANFQQGGLSNKYTDWAVDTSYQQPLGGTHLLSLHAVYTHEDQARTRGSDTLQQFRVDGNYEFGHRGQVSLGYFNTWGSTDKTLYPKLDADLTPPAPTVDTSASGSPDNAGFIAEVDYLPWENTKFSLQYTAYTKFNGAGSNYNGAGRNASDNNTLYLNSWLMW